MLKEIIYVIETYLPLQILSYLLEFKELDGIGISSVSWFLCTLASVWGLPGGMTSMGIEWVRKREKEGEVRCSFLYLSSSFSRFGTHSHLPPSLQSLVDNSIFKAWGTVSHHPLWFPSTLPTYLWMSLMELSSNYPLWVCQLLLTRTCL